MGNDLQTNLGYFMMINYDSFLLCHFVGIFFAMHAGAKELKVSLCNALLSVSFDYLVIFFSLVNVAIHYSYNKFF